MGTPGEGGHVDGPWPHSGPALEERIELGDKKNKKPTEEPPRKGTRVNDDNYIRGRLLSPD